MFDALFEGIGWLLAFFYELVPNYAVAIALLTLTIMALTTPLTIKSTKSMLQMQALQPEMKRIQQKYRDDKQKQNEEMMKFYQENGINPVGGCLPMLLQLPVFILLFQIVKGLTHIPEGQDTFVPKHISETSDLYKSLHGQKEMTAFGIDLAKGASEVLSSDGFVKALPYLLLVAIVAVTAFYQQRQLQRRNPQAAQSNPANNIMKFMPLITVLISFRFPAALVIYFVVSNLYRVGMQAYITRALYGHDESPGKKAQRASQEMQAEKKGKGGGGGAVVSRPTNSPDPKGGGGKGTATPKSPQNQNRPSANGNSRQHARSKKKRPRR